MKNNVRTILIGLAVLIGAIIFLWAGYAWGRAATKPENLAEMNGTNAADVSASMGTTGLEPDMMTGEGRDRSNAYDSSGLMDENGVPMGDGYAYGNRMGNGYGVMGGMGYGSSGMMGGYSGMVVDVEPLSVNEARDAIDAYLSAFDQNAFAIEEIMIFDNNAYAIILEKDTGVGAFELLVDPVTRAVFPEYGPNMMWNLKYGMMSDFGGYGMMGPGMMMGEAGYRAAPMGGYDAENGAMSSASDISAEMPVTPEEALETAQRYLDQYMPGVQVSDEITRFYGYYTIDLEQDGQIIGMLSVNGFTRQVFPHTWHGAFIEMATND